MIEQNPSHARGENPRELLWLQGGGEMGARIRAYDWSQTSLGPVDTWPQSLKTTINIVLNSRYPMFVWWGEQLIKFYNDGYIPMLGARHPAALGMRAKDVWSDIWHIVGPQAAIVLQEGRATWNEEVLLVMERNNFVEETYFTWSYSPVADDHGVINGVFCAVTEETPKVLGRRRLKTLRDLGERALSEAKSVDQACQAAARTLAENDKDLPFALVYLLEADRTGATLRATVRLERTPPAPQRVSIGGESDLWNFAGVLSTGEARARDAVVLPLARPGVQDVPAGFLVAGVSPHLVLDEEYRGFLELVAGHIATAIGSARTYEDERKRAEALAQIDRAKTAFFSNVTHEFRTPLTLMLGPTEDALAVAGRTLDRASLEIFYRNELRLLKLVNALLDFSRIEAGRMQPAFEPTDLAQLTLDVAGVFRLAIERAGLRYAVTSEPLSDHVYVDREMWQKILSNLISNALKFTFEGGIDVNLRDAGTQVEFTIRDTGIGIAEEEKPRLFERFHRIEGVRARTHEGSGIGLALVDDLVRLHGGSIDVASSPGGGTTFTIRLPKGTAHLPQDRLIAPAARQSTAQSAAYVEEALRWVEPAPAEQNLSEAAGNLGADGMATTAAGRILVADDNADMRDYLTRLLRPHWEVEAVHDGQAALERARERPPDLVLTDVMMPGLDGFALLRALRAEERTARIPVVMLSARADEEARVEGLQHGADEYLVKPFSARELIARVNSQLVLAQHAREREHLLEREQRARREAELQKQHLFSLFMQAPALIVVLRGPDHVIELANPLACRLWGRSLEQVIDKPLLVALPELEGQPFNGLLDNVLRTGVPYVGEETPATLDRGEGVFDTVYLTFVYTPIRNVDGEIEGVFVAASDVTQQVHARQQVDQLREAAESANRAKDEFVAMLGHELRNPLAPIQTALQLMRLRSSDATQRERTVIERQVLHLTRLVDDLLDVSRIARGKIQLNREPIEIAEIVAKAIEVASPLLEQRQHALEVDVAREGLLVDGDSLRLAQVVANLLTNAAKYTETGGHISLRASRSNGDVIVSVRDTGIGISPAMLPRIFDLFVQERQALDRSQGGLGLGLTIVRSLVTLHGGSVTANSEGLGRGSEFVITVPAAVSSSIEEGRMAAPQRPPRLNAADRQRVLVVDDNEDAAEMLVEVLLSQGHDARAAHDGPAALRICATFRPTIALLDIGLPVMDGYELAERLRQLPAMGHLRLIAVTGYGQETDRQQATAAGFDRHMVKPIDLDALERTIRELKNASNIS